MIFVLDVAADRFGARMFWFFPGEERVDGLFEIILRRLRAIFSESENAIVDASAINEFAFGIQDRRFGSHGGASGFDEFVIRVAKKIGSEMIIVAMCRNFCVAVGTVWVNEIERDFVGWKFMAKTFDFGREFVGDRTFRADENEDDKFCVGFQRELRGQNRQRQKYEGDEAQQHANRITHHGGFNMRFDLRGREHKLVVRR